MFLANTGRLSGRGEDFVKALAARGSAAKPQACAAATTVEPPRRRNLIASTMRAASWPTAWTIDETRCGRICIGKRKINLSKVFAGQCVGIREVDEQIWLVSFMHNDLSFFDQDEGRVEPAPNRSRRIQC
jgi:hypothetical protein